VNTWNFIKVVVPTQGIPQTNKAQKRLSYAKNGVPWAYPPVCTTLIKAKGRF